jgi:hypothetical protein
MGLSYEQLGITSPFFLAAAMLLGVSFLTTNGTLKQAG